MLILWQALLTRRNDSFIIYQNFKIHSLNVYCNEFKQTVAWLAFTLSLSKKQKKQKKIKEKKTVLV